MRKSIPVSLASLLSLSLSFLFVGRNSATIQEGYVYQEEYVPNEALVKFKKGVSKYLIQEAINSVQGKSCVYLNLLI